MFTLMGRILGRVVDGMLRIMLGGIVGVWTSSTSTDAETAELREDDEQLAVRRGRYLRENCENEKSFREHCEGDGCEL